MQRKGGIMERTVSFFSKKNMAKRRCCVVALVIGALCCSHGVCCGGGYVPMPYIPSGGGSLNTPSSKGSFYLIEKGSANDLFEIKSLQPLFRNIHMSGNERQNLDKFRKNRKADAGDKNAKTDMAAADSVKIDSATCPSAAAAPVLNLHRIH
jgi:hypothetical protein